MQAAGHRGPVVPWDSPDDVRGRYRSIQHCGRQRRREGVVIPGMPFIRSNGCKRPIRSMGGSWAVIRCNSRDLECSYLSEDRPPNFQQECLVP